MESRFGIAQPGWLDASLVLSENPLVRRPSPRGCGVVDACERTIQFSRTEGAGGSVVGGDTVVARAVTVKRWASYFGKLLQS